jgi:hypothetical protein
MAENRAAFSLRRRRSLGFSKCRWVRTIFSVPSRSIFFFNRRKALSTGSPFFNLISVKLSHFLSGRPGRERPPWRAHPLGSGDTEGIFAPANVNRQNALISRPKPRWLVTPERRICPFYAVIHLLPSPRPSPIRWERVKLLPRGINSPACKRSDVGKSFSLSTGERAEVRASVASTGCLRIRAVAFRPQGWPSRRPVFKARFRCPRLRR